MVLVSDDEDILEFDTGSSSWSIYFDGSDVGVTNDVNAFTLLSDGTILISFNTEHQCSRCRHS